MKWTALALVTALAGAAGPAAANAACTPLPDADAKCQDAIGKAGALYAKLALKAMQGCLVDYQKGKISGPDAASVCVGTLVTPPTDPKAAQKLSDAATKAAAKIAIKCTDANVAALDLCAPTVAGLSTCLVDQHKGVVIDAIDAEAGTVVQSSDDGEQKCFKTIGKEAGKFLVNKLKAVQGCLKNKNKVCDKDDELASCLAPSDPGPKDEVKTRGKIEKALVKMADKIALGCTSGQIAALDACGDDVGGLLSCITCNHGQNSDRLARDEYKSVNEVTGTVQAALDATNQGDTIIIPPGTYSEAVTVKDTAITLLGHKNCATGARAVLDDGGTGLNGVYACGSRLTGCPDVADNLVMQGFEADNYQDNDIYTVGLERVVFRDLVTNGPGIAGGTKYGPFPILSNNVLIENCLAEGIADAAIYVGQSINIIVRNNEVRNSVAGIEIENSANAEVYGNYAHDNAGGLLVFKLPGLPVQTSQCHYFHDNTVTNNNGPNYGVGLVGAVPRGTGMIVLSDDTTIFQDNVVTGNGSFGLSVVDQQVLDALFGSFGGVYSADYIVERNRYIDNEWTGNGGSPDPAIVGFEGDITYVVNAPPPGGESCQNGNLFVPSTFSASFQALGACPTTPIVGCPFVPPPTTTTSTSPPSTTTTTTLPPTFTSIYTNIIGPNCGGCHPNVYPALDLDTQADAYANLVNIVSNELATMDRVEPGDPTNSFLQYKLDGNQGTLVGCGVPGCGGQMPLGFPALTLAERDAVRAWIANGAPNN